MSWGATYTVVGNEGQYKIEPSGVNSDEAKEQFDKAILLVRNIIDSEVLGDRDLSYRVNLSGHANPKHEKTPGWANDCLTISISQMDE